MKRYMFTAFSVLMVLSFILAACGTKTVTQIVEKVVKETSLVTVKETSLVTVKETSLVKVIETKEVSVVETQLVEVTPSPVPPTPVPTPYPKESAIEGRIQIRWYVGLGTGTDPIQFPVEKAVVDDFNAQPARETDKIQLILEVIPYASAKDTLMTQIAAGAGPDVIGPVGWGGSNTFYGQWGDIGPYIEASGYDLTQFNPALVEMYQTELGQVGLPFAVFPSAIFYIPALFDEAGLEYPPAKYGDMYVLNGAEVEWSWDTLKQVAQLLTVDGTGKSSAEAGFDKNTIVQYGYTWQYEGNVAYWGSFWQGGSLLVPGGSAGTYKSQAPDVWKAAWAWTYEGIWGDQPWMANSAVEGGADFSGIFDSGKIGMTDQPIWYKCCVSHVTWDLAAMPSYNGVVSGRIDADTFRMWKGTKHPQEAFTVISYLVGEAVEKLIIGTEAVPPAYGALPARESDMARALEVAAKQFPFVTNWQVIVDGLAYPDVPSAEGWMPNYAEAWTRGDTFSTLLRNTSGLDLEQEIAAYLADLEVIFNK